MLDDGASRKRPRRALFFDHGGSDRDVHGEPIEFPWHTTRRATLHKTMAGGNKISGVGQAVDR
jgi:hypothetical protein